MDEEPTPGRVGQGSGRRRRFRLIAVALVALVALAGIGGYFLARGDVGPATEATTVSTLTTASTPTSLASTAPTSVVTSTPGTVSSSAARPNTWTNLHPSGGGLPQAGGFQSMTAVYDPATNEVLMIGIGALSPENEVAPSPFYFSDASIYDPVANRLTDLSPGEFWAGGVSGQSMVYDPATAQVITFGGRSVDYMGNEGSCLNDTSAHDPTAKTESDLHPTGSLPSARAFQSMVYDPSTGRVIMFGGAASDGSCLGDTWAYDPVANTWTDLSPSGTVPSPRSGESMVYDSSTGEVIMFGGAASNGFGLNDTWVYDPTTNSWADLQPFGAVPSARESQSMVYDAATNRVIMFGGTRGGAVLSDTWAYDFEANTWTDLSPSGALPGARLCQSLVYDSFNGKVIMFGGNGTAGTIAWVYDPTTNTWTDLHPSGTLLAGSLIYDSSTHQVILFGATSTSEGPYTGFSDKWAYDLASNTWTNLPPSATVPPGRIGPSLVYDSFNGKVIMFGGAAGPTTLNDTWAYDPAANTWTNLHPSGPLPPGRLGESLVCDSANGKVLMFGGNGTAGNDIWAYNPVVNRWNKLHPSGALPPARLGSSLVYDASSGQVLMFGGLKGSAVFNDTWAYDRRPTGGPTSVLLGLHPQLASAHLSSTTLLPAR